MLLGRAEFGTTNVMRKLRDAGLFPTSLSPISYTQMLNLYFGYDVYCVYIYICIYIYRLPPLPPTSQKVGWGWLLEALAQHFTKSRIWSYGRYAHSGIRVRPKTRKKDMFAKKGISLKDSSLKLKVGFFTKVEIWFKIC